MREILKPKTSSERARLASVGECMRPQAVPHWAATSHIFLCGLFLLMVSLCGCTLVPCNHTFPVARWYWSAEAKDCRQAQLGTYSGEPEK